MFQSPVHSAIPERTTQEALGGQQGPEMNSQMKMAILVVEIGLASHPH